MAGMMRYSRRVVRLLASAGAFAACSSAPAIAMAPAPGGAARAAAQAHCPVPSWALSRTGKALDRPIVNLIQLDRVGKLYWNGAPVEQELLGQFLALTAAMTPRPQTHLEVDPATPCAEVARIVEMIGRSAECRRTCRYRVAAWHPFSPISPPAPPPRPHAR